MRHAAAAAAILLGTAVPGIAAPVLQEDFSQDVPGRKGGQILNLKEGFAYQGPGGDNLTAGSYVEYDLRGTPFNPAQGTIELDVTRAEVEDTEAIFSFADSEGERLVTFYVTWSGGLTYVDPERVLLRPFVIRKGYAWQTPAKDDFKNNVLRPWADIGKTFTKGKTVHLAMSWNAKGIDLMVDGTRPVGRSNPDVSVAGALKSAAKLVIGGQTSTRIPGGAWSMTRSLLANVQLHDRVLAAGELAAPIPPKGPFVFGFEHDAARVAGFSGKLVAGNTVAMTLQGTPGASASYDIVHFPDVASNIVVDWRGWGLYLEEKVFYEEGEVNLRDVEGYDVYASQERFDPANPGFEPLAQLKVQEQRYVIEAPEVDKPYYVAVMARMRDGSKRAVIAPVAGRQLAETAPGVYTGTYTVGWADRYARAVAIGAVSAGSKTATLAAGGTFAVDPSLTLTVSSDKEELPADEKSVANLTVHVTDANGNDVPDHEVKFQLFTTSQYTGVVGGGAFADQVGGTVKESRWGKTDLFGKVTATYVAGFAAKTAIVVARDMVSNDTGAAWVKTFITATAQLELVPVREVLAAADGYEIAVTSSDEWLTADGRSEAKITAKVTQFGNPVEGHQVVFSVSSGTGSIRTVNGTTNREGVARAVYTAGKKIGMVLITATDTTVDLTGSVQIELRSDAPAKLVIKIDPEQLPADGRSRADVDVLVTDINDNPNDNVEVEYAVVEGGGSMRSDRVVTDRNGESTSEYVAGTTPGRVSIGITVRSTVPTEEELAKVRAAALSVTDFDFF